MLKIENTEVLGWEHAIRGMRNPMNSWEMSDSGCEHCFDSERDCDMCGYHVGPNDFDLMKRLRNAGTDHRKFMRMIVVYVDLTAPLYWWKEFDTYKVGTVANSCSTMHKIAAKEFTLKDFSREHLTDRSMIVLQRTIAELNFWRKIYLDGYPAEIDYPEIKPKDKNSWWQMIQLLPSSYNQRRTVMLNYEVLANIYKSRKDHKLDEWRIHATPDEHAFHVRNFSSGMWGFCDWIESLPYSELITGKGDTENAVSG